mmetsp:Transcript_3116/g.6741  ORF Transcript_3116/g.6741 Transcript_3116/m.6741 type:complete len:267 (+) Transcript_3116:86-886(+)
MMAEEENEARRAEELDALRSFYEDDLVSDGSNCWKIRVASKVILELRLPPNYPTADAPIPMLVAPSWALDEGRKSDVLKDLHEMITPGMEMAIMLAEHCRAELGGDDDNVVGGDNVDIDIGTETSMKETSASSPAQHVDLIIAVIEFHHMLIGPSHKKESLALSAAPANGIDGYIFMGGPSFAVVRCVDKQDVINWLQECKKSGKPGNVGYWKSISIADVPSDWPNKLRVMGYAGGRGDKPDAECYKRTLSLLNIAYPLPSSCPEI